MTWRASDFTGELSKALQLDEFAYKDPRWTLVVELYEENADPAPAAVNAKAERERTRVAEEGEDVAKTDKTDEADAGDVENKPVPVMEKNQPRLDYFHGSCHVTLLDLVDQFVCSYMATTPTPTPAAAADSAGVISNGFNTFNTATGEVPLSSTLTLKLDTFPPVNNKQTGGVQKCKMTIVASLGHLMSGDIRSRFDPALAHTRVPDDAYLGSLVPPGTSHYILYVPT